MPPAEVSRGVEVTATVSIVGAASPVGVTRTSSAPRLSPSSPPARSSKVCSVPFSSGVTVKPDALVSPGPLSSISIQSS